MLKSKPSVNSSRFCVGGFTAGRLNGRPCCEADCAIGRVLTCRGSMMETTRAKDLEKIILWMFLSEDVWGFVGSVEAWAFARNCMSPFFYEESIKGKQCPKKMGLTATFIYFFLLVDFSWFISCKKVVG